MSEKSLDQLIASLKTEAIEAAETEAEKILADAKQQADQMLQAAADQKATLLANAEAEAAAIRQKGEAALRQAGRDYSISVRNELLVVFQTVLEGETRSTFRPNLLKEIIGSVIENIGRDVELSLSEADAKELAEYIHNRFQSSEQAVSVLANQSVLSGFVITPTEEGWSYTISAEEVAESLKKHLNKNWLKILEQEI